MSKFNPDANLYKNFAALRTYIDRIGAQQTSPRSFRIFETKNNGYERTIARIHLKNGEIKFEGDPVHEPTEIEREAIAAEKADTKFPNAVTTTRAKLAELKKHLGPDAVLYVVINQYPDRPDLDVLMVRQRYYTEDGKKKFACWSYCDDGLWHRLAPDGKLPFWKPELEREHARRGEKRKNTRPERGGRRIMIHEGEKKAQFCTELKKQPKALAAHPFGKEIAQYDHWGMTCGANHAHKMNWGEVRAENPTDVVYVADNDDEGRGAIKDVSLHYGDAIKVVQFDNRWRESWDLADEMPRSLFDAKTGKYKGPKLWELMIVATFATKEVPTKGRPTYVLRPEFVKNYISCVSPEAYIPKELPQLILGANEFNNRVAPFSQVDDTARLMRKPYVAKVDALAYRPDLPTGAFIEEQRRYFNTHIPSRIVAVEGDPAPFLDYLSYMVPVEGDRLELMRWLATLIARPEIKMLYGVILVSETQGIGKGTLGERILTPILGALNVSYPSESDIVEGAFNYWAAHKRLAFVHEIYAGQSAKAYNKLKQLVTDKFITVNKKHQASYEIENWLHMIACSNSSNALKLSDDDRRWLVPQLTNQKRPTQYWIDFNRWLTMDDGLGIIVNWAHEFLKENEPVLTGAAAPSTQAKRDMIEDGWSPGQRLISYWLEHLKDQRAEFDANRKARAEGREKATPEEIAAERGRLKMVVTAEACVEMVRVHVHNNSYFRLEKQSTIAKIAKALGWHVSDRDKRQKFRGINTTLFATDPELLAMTPDTMRKMGIMIVDQADQAWG